MKMLDVKNFMRKIACILLNDLRAKPIIFQRQYVSCLTVFRTECFEVFFILVALFCTRSVAVVLFFFYYETEGYNKHKYGQTRGYMFLST